MGNMKEDQIKVDLSAGVDILASRIKNRYSAYMICNDVSPTCLKILRKNGLQALFFDLDSPRSERPFPEEYFDAVISMVAARDLPAQKAQECRDIQSNCSSSVIMKSLNLKREWE
jgi:hypothetical protein